MDDLDHWDRTFGDEYKLSSQRRDQAVSKREKESGTFPAQFDSTRSEILAELRLKLMEYGAYHASSTFCGLLTANRRSVAEDARDDVVAKAFKP